MKDLCLNRKCLNNNTCSLLIELIEKSSSSQSVKEYLNHINYQISNVGFSKRKTLFNRMINGSNNEFIECIAELSFQSLWEYFQWTYKKDLLLDKKTPDFSICLHDSSNCIAEVTTLRSNHPPVYTVVSRKKGIFELLKKKFCRKKLKPSLIIRNNSTGEVLDKLPLAINPIQQDGRINIEIKQKYNKYSSLLLNNKIPMIICFYQPDFNSSFFISKFQIQVALFGKHTINWNGSDNYFSPQIDKDKYGNQIIKGVFASNRYSQLSAILFMKKDFSNSKNKYVFITDIYINPLSIWNIHNNPFSCMGLNVNYIDSSNSFCYSESNIIELF